MRTVDGGNAVSVMAGGDAAAIGHDPTCARQRRRDIRDLARPVGTVATVWPMRSASPVMTLMSTRASTRRYWAVGAQGVGAASGAISAATTGDETSALPFAVPSNTLAGVAPPGANVLAVVTSAPGTVSASDALAPSER